MMRMKLWFMSEERENESNDDEEDDRLDGEIEREMEVVGEDTDNCQEVEGESESDDDDDDDSENSDDSDIPLYCICKKPERGRMIACDNKNCKIEWFHYKCIGIAQAPKGKWYCKKCLSS